MDDNGRVDYVRVRLPKDAESCAARYYELDEMCSIIEKDRKLGSKWWGRGYFFDVPTHQWVSYFNCWGEGANVVIEHLNPTTYYKLITRLDWRKRVTGATYDVDALEDCYQQHNANKKRRNTSKYDTQPKSKKDGRPTGGTSYVVGGKGSPRRLTYYKRSMEGPAVEFNSSGANCGNLTKMAIQLYYDEPATSFAEAVRELLEIEMNRFCKEQFGFASQVLVDGTHEQIFVTSLQESWLAQFDKVWEQLDDTARQVIREKIDPPVLDSPYTVPTFNGPDWTNEPLTTDLDDDLDETDRMDGYDEYTQGDW